MKKAVIIFLIILVLGVLAFFIYTEIHVDELTMVSTMEKDDENGKYYVKRLYSSGVDVEALNEKVENLLLLEFSEEDVLAAAMELGRPEFYPSFRIHTYRSDSDEDGEDTVYMDIAAVQELAKGQTEAKYSMTNLKAEILTTGVSITEAEAVGADMLNRVIDESIIKNESGTGMVVELNDYGTVNLRLKGVTGSVTLQFTYDVKKNSLLPATALEGCFTMIRVNIITNAEGVTDISYSVNPSTTIEEYVEQ